MVKIEMMLRSICIIALIALLAWCMSGCTDERTAEDAQAAENINAPVWPCPTGSFRGDNVTAYECPVNPVLSWSVELPGSKCTPPVIDKDGRIIVGTTGGLKCITPMGEEAWSAEINTHEKSPPAIDGYSRIIAGFGDTLQIVDSAGKVIATKQISKHATHHPTVDSQGNIYIYCMEPVDLADIAPDPPEDLKPQSIFKGHIYIFDRDLNQVRHVHTGIINCPLRPYEEEGKPPGVLIAPKLFDGWRTDNPSDAANWKTWLYSTSGQFEPVTLEEIEHGVVDMFFDGEGILHLFGHVEHMPFANERNVPLNEYGYVYRVWLFLYDPETGDIRKEHWPWMTSEEVAVGTYKEFRKYFNYVRFISMTTGMDAYTPALGSEGHVPEEACHHTPGEHVVEEVKEFVKGCRYLIMSETGRMVGGTDSIRCFDVAANKVIWEIDGDPGSIALTGDGRIYCLERFKDEDMCILKCFRNKM